MRADNDRARDLYERNGYREVATLGDYYEDGAPACRYDKTLA